MTTTDPDRDTLVAPSILEKRAAPSQILHCYCCGEGYVKGHFSCCKPRPGVPSHVWLARYCKDCKKCPKHCMCANVMAIKTNWSRFGR